MIKLMDLPDSVAEDFKKNAAAWAIYEDANTMYDYDFHDEVQRKFRPLKTDS